MDWWCFDEQDGSLARSNLYGYRDRCWQQITFFHPRNPSSKLKVHGGAGPILQAYSWNECAWMSLNLLTQIQFFLAISQGLQLYQFRRLMLSMSSKKNKTHIRGCMQAEQRNYIGVMSMGHHAMFNKRARKSINTDHDL